MTDPMQISIEIQLYDVSDMLKDPVGYLRDLLQRMEYRIFDTITSDRQGMDIGIFPATGEDQKPVGNIKIWSQFVPLELAAFWSKTKQEE